MAFTIDTSELNAVAAQLSAAGARTETMARLAVAKTAKDLERIAKVFVPKDTHATENSISVSMAISGHGLSATVGPTTDYAVYLEYGTRRMAQRAFMGPALDRVAPDFQEAMEQIGGTIFG